MLNNLKLGKKKQPEQKPQSSTPNKTVKIPMKWTKEGFTGEIPEDMPPIKDIKMTMDYSKAEGLQQDLNTSSQATIDETVTGFDHFLEQAEAEQEQQREAEQQAVISKMMTREEFRQNFIGLHGFASVATGIQALSLPNTHINEATANEVADTFYETILDVPMLHFMLYPGNKWLGRGFVVMMYVQGMRAAIKVERGKGQKADFSAAKQSTKQKTHDTGELSPDQAAALTGV
jgi:hypothetical protein